MFVVTPLGIPFQVPSKQMTKFFPIRHGALGAHPTSRLESHHPDPASPPRPVDGPSPHSAPDGCDRALGCAHYFCAPPPRISPPTAASVRSLCRNLAASL